MLYVSPGLTLKGQGPGALLLEEEKIDVSAQSETDKSPPLSSAFLSY